MRIVTPTLTALLLLGSCGSPPKPPTVDDSHRRPANSAAAIELLSCKTDLQNTRIVAAASSRLVESVTATASRLALRQQALDARPPAEVEMANTVYAVQFTFASSQVVVPPADVEPLVDQARGAALVMLRARTDGSVETAGESRIARERAIAVRAWLVQSGIEPARIRMTWQPVGDLAADNSTPGGRAVNRRVEIEMYHFMPKRLAPAIATSAL